MLNKLLAATCLAFSCSTVSASLIEASQDPDALYSIVSMSGDSSDRTVITQRVGISGTSYSARQFDCTKRTVRFLGSGISLDDLKSAVADKEATPIFKGSLARAISQEACGESLQPEATTAANSAMAAQNQPITSATKQQ